MKKQKKPQKEKQTMPLHEAIAIVPDDLPDGAYWAMVYDIAGLDYGDGFDDLPDPSDE